ncbi:hypothetical protein ACFZBU_16710 [Embleya sp. NPDC008237]|uniref:hypothetical protein n=1 Tax=Embleya sp. NPDC008237 TaxID=3363978 RepID=UPI0036E59518
MNSPDATTPNAALVHEHWQLRQAPYGDFIVFADGSLAVMDLLRVSPADRPHDRRAEQWYWGEALRATAWTPTDWMDVDSTSASCSHEGSRALAGESSNHGSIGWVALTRADDSLEWLAVSCWSNPFTEVTLNETQLIATCTLGRIWTFPRGAPQQVKITEDPAYPWPTSSQPST